MAEKNGGAGPVTLVFNVDLHCAGCAQKVRKSLKQLSGVVSVKTDRKTNKVTVAGNVDPAVLNQILEEKTKKKVNFQSPQPAKKDSAGDGAGKKSDGQSEKKLTDGSKKPDGKKSKEAPPTTTTVVLKTDVHCDGCATKMTKIVSRYKGVESVNVEVSKDQIVIKGTMDMKQMLPYLNVKFKKPVEVIPPPEKKSGGDSDKKPKGENVKPATGGGEENVGKIENVNKMDYYYGYPYGYGGTLFYNPHAPPPPGYGYPMEYGIAPPPPPYLHAPLMFSDENPNACSVM
ncbi:hypothetical protein V2J09_009795 [Rumex salicifolius]